MDNILTTKGVPTFQKFHYVRLRRSSRHLENSFLRLDSNDRDIQLNSHVYVRTDQ